MPHVIVKLWPGKGLEKEEIKVLAATLILLTLFASSASRAQTSAAKAPTSSSIKIARGAKTRLRARAFEGLT